MRIIDDWIVVYETLDELIAAGIISATEYEGSYYIEVKHEYEYDERIWKVDKKTGAVTSMHLIPYMCNIEKKAKKIDPATLRRGA